MKKETAVFAMGCFWCSEAAFRDVKTHEPLNGILLLRVGYSGGIQDNPTYENHEGYKEAIQIVYDPDVIDYESLLAIFWKNVDPLDGQGQFADKGPAYTSAIFYADSHQKESAFKSHEHIKAQLKDNFTEIIAYTSFYEAEAYHQNYKMKNPITYCYYRLNCGRERRLKDLWGVL